jgi:hypothetical protein
MKMNKEKDLYFWNFNMSDEVWHDCECSIENCIEEARQVAKYDNLDFEYIFVGKLNKHKPHIHADYIIDNLIDYAWENEGESAEGWLAGVSRESEEELEKMLNEALKVWMQNNNCEPEFGGFSEITKYNLITGKKVESEEIKNGQENR